MASPTKAQGDHVGPPCMSPCDKCKRQRVLEDSERQEALARQPKVWPQSTYRPSREGATSDPIHSWRLQAQVDRQLHSGVPHHRWHVRGVPEFSSPLERSISIQQQIEKEERLARKLFLGTSSPDLQLQSHPYNPWDTEKTSPLHSLHRCMSLPVMDPDEIGKRPVGYVLVGHTAQKHSRQAGSEVGNNVKASRPSSAPAVRRPERHAEERNQRPVSHVQTGHATQKQSRQAWSDVGRNVKASRPASAPLVRKPTPDVEESPKGPVIHVPTGHTAPKQSRHTESEDGRDVKASRPASASSVRTSNGEQGSTRLRLMIREEVQRSVREEVGKLLSVLTDPAHTSTSRRHRLGSMLRKARGR